MYLDVYTRLNGPCLLLRVGFNDNGTKVTRLSARYLYPGLVTFVAAVLVGHVVCFFPGSRDMFIRVTSQQSAVHLLLLLMSLFIFSCLRTIALHCKTRKSKAKASMQSQQPQPQQQLAPSTHTYLLDDANTS